MLSDNCLVYGATHAIDNPQIDIGQHLLVFDYSSQEFCWRCPLRVQRTAYSGVASSLRGKSMRDGQVAIQATEDHPIGLYYDRCVHPTPVGQVSTTTSAYAQVDLPLLLNDMERNHWQDRPEWVRLPLDPYLSLRFLRSFRCEHTGQMFQVEFNQPNLGLVVSSNGVGCIL